MVPVRAEFARQSVERICSAGGQRRLSGWCRRIGLLWPVC